MQKFVYILIKQSCWEGISFERVKPVRLQVHKHLTNIDYTRLSAMLHPGAAVAFHTLSTSTIPHITQSGRGSQKEVKAW